MKQTVTHGVGNNGETNNNRRNPSPPFLPASKDNPPQSAWSYSQGVKYRRFVVPLSVSYAQRDLVFRRACICTTICTRRRGVWHSGGIWRHGNENGLPKHMSVHCLTTSAGGRVYERVLGRGAQTTPNTVMKKVINKTEQTRSLPVQQRPWRHFSGPLIPQFSPSLKSQYPCWLWPPVLSLPGFGWKPFLPLYFCSCFVKQCKLL